MCKAINIPVNTIINTNAQNILCHTFGTELYTPLIHSNLSFPSMGLSFSSTIGSHVNENGSPA